MDDRSRYHYDASRTWDPMNAAFEWRSPVKRMEFDSDDRHENSPRGFAIMAILIAVLLTAAALY